MPTVIDHAIAIPTRAGYVWEVIRDIPQNPTWQLNSQRVQFLTTVKRGRGTRWRNTTPDNKEQVYEITAWYEGLGYEYRIVDGSPYPQNRGRIRLQEAPEGTIVQWTFSYEVSGFFSSLRNSIGLRGQADKQVVEGLRQLYAYVKEARNEEAYDPEASKAFLKEAPNVVERAEYKPRYPSKLDSQDVERVSVQPTTDPDAPFQPPARQTQIAPQTPIIQEPPVTEGDTRPNAPAAQESMPLPPPPPDAVQSPSEPQRYQAPQSETTYDEPDFLKAMPNALPMDPISYDADAPAARVDDSDVGKTEPEVASRMDAPVQPESVVPPLPIEDAPVTEPTRPKNFMTDEQVPVADKEPDSEPVAAASNPVVEDVDDSEKSVIAGATSEPVQAPILDADADTSQMSVFDIFGLPKPSESQEVTTIKPSDEEAFDLQDTEYEALKPLTPKEEAAARRDFMRASPVVPDVQPNVPERRRGLRAALRRTMRVPDSDG